MADLVYVVMMIVLTAIAVLFSVGCDEIVRPDEVELVEVPRPPVEPLREPEELAA
jgi:hypothetical protein